MRVQFLNPPLFHYTGNHYRMMPPVNLPILAALFAQHGHYAEVIDLEALAVSPDQVEAKYRAQPSAWPDAIGITAMTITSRGARETVQALRRAGFHGLIVAGGIFPTENAETVLGWGVDLVVTGECEGNVVRLFEDRVRGVQAGERMDINAIPSPDWRHHNPPIGEYYGNTRLISPRPGIAMWTRGCPYQCVFCSDNIFNHQAIRYRDPAIIYAEMAELKARGCANVYVYDDELVGTRLPVGWMKEVADRLEPLGLPWITQGRCSKRHITPELMRDVKRAGCKAVFWGVETFSDKVLKAIKKVTTEDDIWHTLQVSHDAGIENAVFTMVGLYRETEADCEYTFKALKRAHALGFIQYRQTTVCTGMPGTPLEKIMRDEGWWVDPPDYGPQMAQVYAPTPWMTKEQILHWATRYAETCPGVP